MLWATTTATGVDVGPNRASVPSSGRPASALGSAGVDHDVGDLEQPPTGGVTRLDAAGVGDRRDADDGQTLALALDGDVEDHGVEARLREQDHRVATRQAVRPQDRQAVPLLLVQEAVLVRAHVAEDVVHQGDRQLDDRAEPGDRPRAREHLEGGERPVAGAEREHEAVALDRVGARRGGGVDGIGLVLDDALQLCGQTAST